MTRNDKDHPSKVPAGGSLDELFARASKDARYLDSESVRQAILENAINNEVPAQLASRMGTRARIGIWTMSTLLLATLTFFAFRLFQPSTVMQATSTHAMTQPAIHSQFQSTIASVSPRYHGGTRIPKPIDTGFFTPVRMEGIQPVQITQAQAEQLGITLYPNGNIGYLLPNVIFEPGGDIELRSNTKGDDSASVSNPALATMQMVTTPTGEKRFFLMQSTELPLPQTLKGFGIDNPGMKIKGGFREEVSVARMSDSSKGGDEHHSLELTPSDSASIAHYLKAQGLDISHGKHMTVSININGTLGGQDSAATNKLLETFGISKAQLAGMLKRGDSAAIAKAITRKVVQTMRSHKGAVRHFVMDALTNLSASEPNINSLVPVLVQDDLGDTANTLIFWFEPSRALASILGTGNGTLPPAHVSSSGALSAISISPNPAVSAATLHYTLADPRALAVSLYDITGNKVLDVARARAEAGSGKLRIDLASARPGIYILVVTTDRGEQLVQRIVVER